MKKATKGSGITEKEVTLYDPNEMRALVDSTNARLAIGVNWFERMIHDVEKWAVDVTNGKDPYSPVDDDSELDFAQRIHRHIYLARSAIAKNDADETARWALKLGHLTAEVSIKFKWEKFALSGKEYSETQRAKGRARASKMWAGYDRDALVDIVEELSSRKDAMGDYLLPRELWPHLYSNLENVGLKPIDNIDTQEPDKSYYQYGESKEKITYGAFRKKIERTRKK